MESWFQARDYSKDLVQKEISKVRFNRENNNTKQSKSKRVTFAVTYHPLLKSFQSLINKHLKTLYLDENAKEGFMPGPMVTFRSSRNLSSNLARAKSYPLERVTGSCKCHGKHCAVCLNVNETSPSTSSVIHETYKINHKFDCNSKCFIYLLTCKQSTKQYVSHGKRCAVCLNVNETSPSTSSVIHETYKINHKFDCNSICLIYLLTCKQSTKQYVSHGKCCAVCLNVNETSPSTSSVTHETYKINHKFDCNSKCLIYLLTCKQSTKQYVSQTMDDF